MRGDASSEVGLAEGSSSWVRFASRPVPNFCIRFAVMIVGLSLIGLGIALGKFSAIGTSPISCIPAVIFDFLRLNSVTVVSLGMLTFGINALFLVLEIALLRRDFNPVQLLQLSALVVMTASIDVWLGLLEATFVLSSYPMQLLFAVLSFVVQALGVFLEVRANVLMVPGEGIVKVVSHVFRRQFKNCKTAFDTSLIAIAAALSIVLMGRLSGVREGSVMSAVFTGQCVGVWGGLLKGIDLVMPPAKPIFPPIVPGGSPRE